MTAPTRTLRASLLLAAAWWALAAFGALEPLERLTMQARYWLRPAPGFTAPVAVVAIDEASLDRYGQMPWDREVFARILDRLGEAGVAVVGIDVAFNEPTAHDAPLEAALSRTPTVLPTFLAFAGASGDALTVVEPLDRFKRHAVGLGSVQLSRRQQQQVWELEPYQDLVDRRVPAFPVALAAAYADKPPTWHSGPIWREAPHYLDYRGPAHSVPQRSVVDLLSGPPPRDLQGRIVLVGATANGLADTNFSVPDMRGGPMAGVEIFAHALDNLLSSGFWQRLSLPATAALLLGLACFPGARLLAPEGLGRRRSAWWLAASILWVALAAAAAWAGIWLEVVPVLGLLFSCALAGLALERGMLLESRNRLLERYAEDMASESQRQRLRLEGELHDGVQQLLIAIGRELRMVRKHLENPERATSRLARADEMTSDALAEIKRLRKDLLPPALRQGGLASALDALALEASDRGQMAVTVDASDWRPLPQATEVELYWLVKEALNNAEKHAGASRVAIRLGGGEAGAELIVEDDGCGFAVPDLSRPGDGIEHSGLHRMWLRMRGRGGDLVITSRPGLGARLTFTAPRPAAISSPAPERDAS